MNQEFPSRYGLRKQEHEEKVFFNRLRIAIAILGIGYLLIVLILFVGVVNTSSEQIKATCPTEDCDNQTVTYGAVLPHLNQDTKEWLTGWCNQSLGTKFECK